MQVLSMYKNYVYRSTHINILDIFMWEILTHIAFIETQDISDENNSIANIASDFQSLQTKFNRYILNGYNYPCSYLLKFRSVLLDKKLDSNVCVYVFIYYVYQINGYYLYFLLD